MADRAPNEIITITARVRDVSYFLRENDDDDMRPTRVTIICDDIPAACRDAEHPTIIEAMSYHWFEPERGQPYKLKGHFKQFTGSEAYFFKVLSVRRQKLDDSTKIMKLLTAYSDMTPAMAERISQRYDTLDSFLQAESAYGQHIDAATKRKWNADAAVIREHPELSNELSLYGLKACKIAQFYEDTGYKAIRRCKNAYMLMDYGASFRQIDELSLMRLEPVDSTERLCAALTDALNDICESGDCYLPMDRFIAATIKKLSLARTKAITGDIIKNTIPAVKDIHIDADNSVYPFRLFEAETAIAREIKRIVGNKKPISANSTLPRNLDHKQLEAVFMPLRHGVSIVTGGPGTGKTTLLQSMIEVLNSACPNSRILLCAPTGRAAKRMEEICGIPAQTIHAATGYRPGVNAYQYIHHDDTPEMEYDYIIVDEASMLDVELCWVLLALIPDSATVVLIGDTNQLPPISPGHVLADMLNSGMIPSITLTKAHRQAGYSGIIDIANSIINGEALAPSYGNEVRLIQCAPNEIPQQVISEFQAHVRTYGTDSVRALTPYRRRLAFGSDALNKSLQSIINPAQPDRPQVYVGQQILRLHDPVMQIKNNSELGVYNGEVGVIAVMNDFEITVDYGGGKVIQYSRDAYSELALNYATTIHKSQGSEYDYVVIALSSENPDFLTRNLIYTAITRAKKQVVIIGDMTLLEPGKLRIEHRNTKLCSRIQDTLTYLTTKQVH